MIKLNEHIKYLTLVVLLFIVNNSYSICSRYAQVKYQTSYGWSETHIVQTIFATGNELNEVTKSHVYSQNSIYVIIFWSQGPCSNIKLDDTICSENEILCDYIESDSINLYKNPKDKKFYGYDQYGDKWIINIKNDCN